LPPCGNIAAVRFNLPRWLVRLPFYGALLVPLTLCLVLSPFFVMYWFLLCWRISRESRRSGKDVLTVFADSPSCGRRMQQILPLVSSRSEFLNWSKRETWNRWSIGPQVFRLYSFVGPDPFRLESCLPVVFVFRRFHWPTTFSFGALRTTESEVIDRLKQELEAREKSHDSDVTA
jgi:hypothetical protein